MKLDLNILRKKKIMIATPMYGGQCHGTYTYNSIHLTKLAAQYGLEIDFFFLHNESLITRARNLCVRHFLNSDATHLMFIDSDIGFRPHDVLALAAIAEDGTDKHIVCGPCPAKIIAWEDVKKAVEKGYGDENPDNLSKYTGKFVFQARQGDQEITLHEPMEVKEAGTGFMMIRRETFEKFKETYPELTYMHHIHGEVHAFFDTAIEPGSKRYLSEDYMFCQYATKMGFKVWICPWMELSHTGSYVYNGTLHETLSVRD